MSGAPAAGEPGVRVAVRHQGRLYEVRVMPNGSATVARDGVWLCNGDWNGRTIDTGDHELHADLDTSNAILERLADALREAGAERHSRPGPAAYRRRPRGATD